VQFLILNLLRNSQLLRLPSDDRPEKIVSYCAWKRVRMVEHGYDRVICLKKLMNRMRNLGQVNPFPGSHLDSEPPDGEF
jgi:hypothetical protein